MNYFTKKLDENFSEELYLEFLKAYRLKVETYNCIEDFNVAAYVKRHIEESISTARRATSPFLKITKTLSESDYLPRFIVGDDKNDINDVVESFLKENYSEFRNSPNNKMELPDLKNILVFYDERGNFSMTNDLSYINQMKNAFENVPGGLADENVTKEIWMNNRSAYTTK